MDKQSPRRFRASALASPLLLSLLAVGIVFFILMGVKSLKEKTPDAASEVPATETGERLASRESTGTETQAPGTTGTPVDTEPPASGDSTASAAPASTEAPTTEPAPTEPAARMTEVDEHYFDDALFIGDSRTDGLRLYSPIGDAKYYCGTSLSIYKIMSTTESAYGYNGLRALLKGEQFAKIYIMFGINECGYPTGSFADQYRSVVEEIRAAQPDALIYLQSILYVTQKHEANNPVFGTENLKEKNETIKALANDKDIFYLEVNDALNDGTDHLPSEYTGDGVHLKASYYHLWSEYLLAHAVVDSAHPWTPAEPETSGAEPQ